MAVVSGAEPLAAMLDTLTAPGELCEPLGDSRVRCTACGHRCLILDGYRGVCKVRFNAGGTLRVPYGYVGALQCDPTEKKPFFHVVPGSRALTFGMLGCDFHCPYCQNWVTSQTLRDPNAQIHPQLWSAEGLVRAASELDAALVVSSYNEPLITAEWAHAVFRLARRAGLRCAFVSNGNATRAVLEFMRPLTDAYKIDLKSMRAPNYQRLGGKLTHVLDAIQMVHDLGFWLEIVTLLVPGWNTSDAELSEAARFIAGVSPDIPWHVTAFHKDYRMTEPDNATSALLIHAAQIGEGAGLRYVYAGNLPGDVGPYEDTRCPACHTTTVRRSGYRILSNRMSADGRCPECQTAIPGIWM
ncbi:MAG: AmmeMemoRadiSam system radical SAM enzyme [Actinobacteria bacterium]|nr:AmmeMemoRadiSam system radical SAM enzyme [Actinomycetota bacterium]